MIRVPHFKTGYTIIDQVLNEFSIIIDTRVGNYWNASPFFYSRDEFFGLNTHLRFVVWRMVAQKAHKRLLGRLNVPVLAQRLSDMRPAQRTILGDLFHAVEVDLDAVIGEPLDDPARPLYPVRAQFHQIIQQIRVFMVDKIRKNVYVQHTDVSTQLYRRYDLQIMMLDIIFSLDSVITAVGMAEHIEVMVTAVIIAIVVMLVFAKQIGDFVNRYPSMKILALSFLLLIGVLLTAEGLGQHINKGYIYFAMAFALAVELLNIRFRSKQQPA